MAFCQMPCVSNAALLCTRLFAGMRTRPAVAGILGRRGRIRAWYLGNLGSGVIGDFPRSNWGRCHRTVYFLL